VGLALDSVVTMTMRIYLEYICVSNRCIYREVVVTIGELFIFQLLENAGFPTSTFYSIYFLDLVLVLDETLTR
jgi:hypothetical protein